MSTKNSPAKDCFLYLGGHWELVTNKFSAENFPRPRLVCPAGHASDFQFPAVRQAVVLLDHPNTKKSPDKGDFLVLGWSLGIEPRSKVPQTSVLTITP